MKVVFVTGWGRSGTTLLDRVLGEMPEYTSLGEFRDMTDGRPVATHVCACGKSMAECPFWVGIVPEAMASVGVDERGLRDLLYSTSRQRYLPRLLLTHHQARSMDDVPDYAKYLFAVYERVIARAGRPAIVDSSKSPSDAMVLASHPGIELHLIHLVRDPRGPAYSWSHPKPDPGKNGASTLVLSPAWSSTKWLGLNLAIELFLRAAVGDRYQLVRYEDLMRRPDVELRRIARKLGSDPDALPLVGERQVEFSPGHTMGGNPVRFVHGRVTLAPDVRWVQEMSTYDRLTATLPALPLLHRYRYHLWSADGRSSDRVT
ncbi:MAG TPA: sulfotransferase [Acidimicrobiales bacterium]|nr:sulfotransferase [Acidimicrobiales bacterium]